MILADFITGFLVDEDVSLVILSRHTVSYWMVPYVRVFDTRCKRLRCWLYFLSILFILVSDF